MKGRYWACILYPDSCRENWQSLLEETGLQFCVSPLHDKDIDIYAEGGPKPKKAHWHILLEFEGPKRYKNVKEDICDLIGATIPKKVESLRGYYRYLVHLDNPEKAQYNLEDIQCFNGFKVELTESEVNRIIDDILEKIEKEHIIEYSDLDDYYRYIGDEDYKNVIRKHTYFFDKYICSVRNKLKVQKNVEKK